MDETQTTVEQEAAGAEIAGSTPESREAFAEMLEGGGALPERTPKQGEKIACKVVRTNDEWVFVSFGGKSEGAVARGEFAAPGEGKAEGERLPPLPAEGDTIEAYVLHRKAGELILTTRLSLRDQSKAAIEEAFTAGVPVEGRVDKVIKGGYEVRVSGLRAFCPLSQIDVRWPKEPEVHVGGIYTFKVIEYKEKGRNIIVSRRAILEEERVTKREELKKRIVVGQFVTGKVRNVQNFGAFVDLDGADGLIPVSEMAWSRVEDPRTLLTEGQDVTAKVIGIDWDKERISLSLKALAADPWVAAAQKYTPGSRVQGKVVRLSDFGAFVALEEGVDGMVHISALGAEGRIKHPREAVSVGDLVEAEVLSVDLEKKRIALSLDYKRFEGLGELPAVGETLTGQVEKVVDFGVFLKLPSGHVGLVPNAEMNTRKGADHGQMFRPGDEMEVQVIEVSENGRRIRLSVKALVREKEREARKEYEAYKADDKASFGTFGDLLKGRSK